MAIELQRLMEKVAHMDVTLVAGEGGLHNHVSWVHMVENAALDCQISWKAARSPFLQASG